MRKATSQRARQAYQLARLHVVSFSFAGSAIPWQTLHHLDMWRGHKEGRTDDDADLRDLLRSLETTCNLVVRSTYLAEVDPAADTCSQAIPLRSLILTFNRAADQAVSGLVKFAKTLNAPRLNSLEVDIKSLGALATQTVDARLPSVVCLKLCGPYRFDSVVRAIPISRCLPLH